MNSTSQTLAASLSEWRHHNKLSQNQAAKRLGVAKATWSHWETGKRLPTPRLLLLLSEMTAIPVGRLLCEKARECPLQSYPE